MRQLAATLIGLSLCAPAQAAPPDDPVDAAIGCFLHGLVDERDVALVFGYLREAFDGALHGREVAPPRALTQRAEIIADEVKRCAAIAAQEMVDAIERSIRESTKVPRGRSASHPNSAI